MKGILTVLFLCISVITYSQQVREKIEYNFVTKKLEKVMYVDYTTPTSNSFKNIRASIKYPETPVIRVTYQNVNVTQTPNFQNYNQEQAERYKRAIEISQRYIDNYLKRNP